MELRSLHQGHSIELRHPLAGPQPLDLRQLFAKIKPTKPECVVIDEARAEIARLNEHAAQFSEERLGQRLEQAKRAIAEDITEEALAAVAAAAAQAEHPEVRRRVASEVSASIQPRLAEQEARLGPIAARLLREARSAFTKAVSNIDLVDKQLAEVVGPNELAAVLSFAQDRIRATHDFLDQLDRQAAGGGADAALRDRFGV